MKRLYAQTYNCGDRRGGKPDPQFVSAHTFITPIEV